MIRSEISLPFQTFYHNFATLNFKNLSFDFLTVHHHWSYSPRSSFQCSTILPPLMLRPKIFRTLLKLWVIYGLPHSFEYQGWAWGTMKNYLSNLQTWKNRLSSKTDFFQDASSAMYVHQHAACSHSQPLAATCSHLSFGCKWPLEQVGARGLSSKCMAATCHHLWPQMAAVPSEWPQVAASGRPRHFQASGRKWPQVAAPDSSKRVAASGRKWPLQTVPCEWPQVAASGRFRPNQFPPSKQPLWFFLSSTNGPWLP